MKVGLIGLPESGKTSLFNALTRSQAPLHAYESRASEVNTAVVPVPDTRFDSAVAICRPKKQVAAVVEVVDGAARVEVHERGQRFGTDFFSGVRTMDALVLVLRAFRSQSLPEPPQGLDPVRDANTVMQELLLADLTVLDARLERMAKSRASRKQSASEAAEEQAVRALHEMIEAMRPLRSEDLSPDLDRVARAFALLSYKPLILVVNESEDDIALDSPVFTAAAAFATSQSLPLIRLCAKVEAEVAQMAEEEEHEFLLAMGVGESARDALIRVAYRELGLISFLTVGSDEVRAWTIRKGTTALGAAERVHTDLARTFIRAEVMDFRDFESAGGWDAARAAGKMRLEGKEYVVRDGEIVHIRNSRG